MVVVVVVVVLVVVIVVAVVVVVVVVVIVVKHNDSCSSIVVEIAVLEVVLPKDTSSRLGTGSNIISKYFSFFDKADFVDDIICFAI